MIFCPNCGYSIAKLCDGISTCKNCHRTFDTSQINRLLSAAWSVKKLNLSIEDLLYYNNLSDEEVDFIHDNVINKGYTHDELLKLYLPVGGNYELFSKEIS
jgi:hypothetical protein